MEIAVLAHSFQALHFLQMVLYIRLVSEGLRGRVPTLTDPITELGREQAETLPLELGRQGALARHCDRPTCAGLTGRERWRLHRERDGEVWNLQAGVWAGFGVDSMNEIVKREHRCAAQDVGGKELLLMQFFFRHLPE